MIRIRPRWLLFIEPRGPASTVPIIDEYTRRMAGALRVAAIPAREQHSRGIHMCVCRMRSANHHFYVRGTSGRLTTNSLCVHYLAHHRDEVPASELEKVLMLHASACDPLPSDLARDLSPSGLTLLPRLP
jgi:hypothetical protein